MASLRPPLERRAVIEQRKGIVMRRSSCTEDAASALLHAVDAPLT